MLLIVKFEVGPGAIHMCRVSLRRCARNRTITGRTRGRPCRVGVLFQCLWGRAAARMPSHHSLIESLYCSVVPSVVSMMPCIRRLGRLEYCSCRSASASSVRTRFSRLSI